MRDVHRVLRAWMDGLGMESSVDAAGNLRGLYRCGAEDAARLVIASHLDTVPNAGAFDGILGVILGCALIEALNTASEVHAEDRLLTRAARKKSRDREGADEQTFVTSCFADRRPSYDIEVIGFSEEEGVRFGIPFIGSRAFAGTLTADLLMAKDSRSISVREAIANFGLDPNRIPEAAYDTRCLGYLEFHIEQGPVLETLQLPLGVVEAIVGQSRFQVRFEGAANHAGTTPMNLRRDALAGAAQWVIEVERIARNRAGLVATVGRMQVTPGAGNVVPGLVETSLDVRHCDDSVRKCAVKAALASAESIAAERNLRATTELLLDQPAVPCDPRFTQILRRSVSAAGHPEHGMTSGAGHDAMIVAAHMPAAMLFLRSPGGISHHPDESVLPLDVAAAIETGLCFLNELERDQA